MYEAKDFSRLLGTEGFSDDLLNNHFKLYQGYVANTNKVIELLKSLDSSSPEYAELKRRFGWEFNGMRLHELYFSNMSKESEELDKNSRLSLLLEDNFGSVDDWRNDFIATGSMRGIGWAVLAIDKETGKLFNLWINEHDLGHLAGAVPLLIMDVFEHAFVLDYGLNKGDYIKAFLNAVDWNVVEKRLASCGGGGCGGSCACGSAPKEDKTCSGGACAMPKR